MRSTPHKAALATQAKFVMRNETAQQENSTFSSKSIESKIALVYHRVNVS